MPRRREIAALAADRNALHAIKQLPDYQPANSAYQVKMLQQAEAALLAAERVEEQAKDAYNHAKLLMGKAAIERRAATAAFQALMRGAKTQIVAQYGDDSYLVSCIGWTRRSDRRPPGRRPAARRKK